jgi:hypothetical protein
LLLSFIFIFIHSSSEREQAKSVVIMIRKEISKSIED